MSTPDRPLKLLVVQHNNIGDLVLCTPLLGELRRQLPDARIDVLAGEYNAEVLARNRDVDRVERWPRRKHAPGESVLRVFRRKAGLVVALRRRDYDRVLLAPGCDLVRHARIARWIAPGRVRSAWGPGRSNPPRPDQSIVARAFDAARDVPGFEPPSSPTPTAQPCRVFADPAQQRDFRASLAARHIDPNAPFVAVQISARRQRQRWPAERFAALASMLVREHGAPVVVLWAPGSGASVAHPGDDEKAQAVLSACSGLAVFGYATPTLPPLIAALSLASVVVTPDGGAMHLAAGCGVPVVALFGDSDPAQWQPWQNGCRVLRSVSGHVEDIEAGGVFAATVPLVVGRLRGRPDATPAQSVVPPIPR